MDSVAATRDITHMGTDRFSRLFSGPTRESSARVQPEECTAEASVTTSSGSQPAPALVELDSTRYN